MSKRYGRNQRRQHREALAQMDQACMILARDLALERKASDHRERQLREEYERKIKAARVARDTIKITIDSLMDDRDQSITLRGMYEVLGQPMFGPIDTAFKIDPRRDRMTRSQDEREAFCQHVGQDMASYALQQMMRHWRSR